MPGMEAVDSVEWERGRRWGLLRRIGEQSSLGADTAGDMSLNGQGRDTDSLEHAYLAEGLLRQGYIARERQRRAMEDRARASGAQPTPQRETALEKGAAGWIGC